MYTTIIVISTVYTSSLLETLLYFISTNFHKHTNTVFFLYSPLPHFKPKDCSYMFYPIGWHRCEGKGRYTNILVRFVKLIQYIPPSTTDGPRKGRKEGDGERRGHMRSTYQIWSSCPTYQQIQHRLLLQTNPMLMFFFPPCPFPTSYSYLLII